MEPVTTTIVAALVAGAVAATKDVATDAVKSAYKGLKSLIATKFGDKEDLVDAVEKVEADPESKGRKMMLEEEVAKAKVDQDDEVLARAEALLALLEQQGQKAGVSYQATQSGSGGLAQDHSAAAGEGGIAIGRDVQGDVVMGGDKEKDA